MSSTPHDTTGHGLPDHGGTHGRPISFWLGSILDNSENAKQERAAFEAQDVRCQTGIGAEGAASH